MPKTKACLRDRLRRGETVIGSWINSASPVVAELMAACGYDFLTVDVEHSAVNLPMTQGLFQAIVSGSPTCSPLVRLAGNDYAETKRFLDAGAIGVIAPLINTPDQARALVDAVKYPPMGRRGVGFCRDNTYGLRLAERLATANKETLVCVQIEHVEAVENIDAILSVKGVDAAFIGPYDLTASMNIAAQFDHRRYTTAVRRILAACRRHSVVAGIHVVQPEIAQAQAAIRRGFQMIAYSLDITMLASLSRKALIALKSGKTAKTRGK